METRSGATRADTLDIKLGPGGMVDIEFAAQMIQLRFAATQPGLSRRTTAEVLTNMPDHLMGQEERRALVHTYRWYRETEKLLYLSLEERSSRLPSGEKLDLLAGCLDGSRGAHLRTRMEETMKRTRNAFLNLADRLRGAGP
jgi:glutamate-ammonia-ligase adenylyltransferase